MKQLQDPKESGIYAHLTTIDPKTLNNFVYDKERPELIDEMAEYLKIKMSKVPYKRGHYTVIATIYPEIDSEDEDCVKGGRLFF